MTVLLIIIVIVMLLASAATMFFVLRTAWKEMRTTEAVSHENLH